MNQCISSRVGRTSSGFTLIELMIVVAIMAILAAIAIPIYRDYVTRSKLTEAQNLLTNYRTKMEQYFQDNHVYTTTPTGTVCGATLPTAPSNYFTYTCEAKTPTTYIATATGVPAQGTGGFIFTIDNFNNRVSTVPAGWALPNPNNCWVLRKGGGCS